MKRWWHLGVLVMAFGCASEKASGDGSGTNSAGSGAGGTSGQSGASGASSGGSGGSIGDTGYIRYTIDGTTVDVTPYRVIGSETLLDIISGDIQGDSPSLRLTIGWGPSRGAGTFSCAHEPLEPDSTTMDYGNLEIGFWYSSLKEGACNIVIATVTPTKPLSGEATGTFSGTVYPMSDEAPKTVTNGRFRVRYEPYSLPFPPETR